MSFGEHLDELRSRLIRALLGIAVGTGLSLFYGKEILETICQPLLMVQFANGLPPRVLALSPTGPFSMYLKIGFLTGLILSMPWVLYQGWLFVASGLHAHERRFMKLLTPISLLLFFVGVIFLYFVVLPIVLHFFIGFNKSIAMPDLTPSSFQSLLLPGAQSGASQTVAGRLKTPILGSDPIGAEVGDTWVNAHTRRLMLQTADGVWSMPLEPGATPGAMQSEFALDEYVSFVLTLALAFGIAFETPVVVFFLGWSGIVPSSKMARSRRYVLLGIVIVAAVLTPPDVISQMLLALPMYLLFELGIAAAWFMERKSVRPTTDN